ncbi:hypothetical protein CMO91_01620 [Candidatus Woesearchaeota archaeon]|nr:hypothetical protein [Candidatus Woesearchaeota archaeon]|tara:strand:- start:81 stop:359 length:279 start_codon:yes stop_codon:yes gene_type:complete
MRWVIPVALSAILAGCQAVPQQRTTVTVPTPITPPALMVGVRPDGTSFLGKYETEKNKEGKPIYLIFDPDGSGSYFRMEGWITKYVKADKPE